MEGARGWLSEFCELNSELKGHMFPPAPEAWTESGRIPACPPHAVRSARLCFLAPSSP